MPTATVATVQDSLTNWASVRDLEGREVIIDAVGFASREARIESVDTTSITVVDLSIRSRPTLKISREAVNEIKRWTGRNGSVVGAAVGVGVGALAGFVTALNLAYKQCGAGCSDEKALMALSLVGMPIGGGLLGYKLPGGNRALTTVYRR